MICAGVNIRSGFFSLCISIILLMFLREKEAMKTEHKLTWKQSKVAE